jgi:hypothetical protein
MRRWHCLVQLQAYRACAEDMRTCAFTSTVQWILGSRTPPITNKSVHEQIFRTKKSRVTNGVSSNEHASRQQRLATSWVFRRESVSCCVTFVQYTSLPELAVPSLEFHCVLWFFNILLNKTPWNQRSFGLRKFRMTNGLQERIKFVNRGSTMSFREHILAYPIYIFLHHIHWSCICQCTA